MSSWSGQLVRPLISSILYVGLLLLMVGATSLAALADEIPAPVRERCEGAAPPSESLCNIEPELRPAYRITEKHVTEIDIWGSALIPDLVRSGIVGVDWYPESLPIRPRLYAFYAERSRMVWVARSLRDAPERAQVAVVAHELTHAAWDRHALGAGMPNRTACLQNEQRAHAVGMTVYERLNREAGNPEPRGDADELLARDLELWRQSSRNGELSAAGLEIVTRNHVFTHGYASGCSWEPA